MACKHDRRSRQDLTGAVGTFGGLVASLGRPVAGPARPTAAPVELADGLSAGGLADGEEITGSTNVFLLVHHRRRSWSSSSMVLLVYVMWRFSEKRNPTSFQDHPQHH